jgi:RNA polymerase subunit RPABC4/transcription elongation factor Spt4
MTIYIKKCRVCKVIESYDYDTCEDCNYRATVNETWVDKQTELEKENVH